MLAEQIRLPVRTRQCCSVRGPGSEDGARKSQLSARLGRMLDNAGPGDS
jgi:hypothetical protein